MHLCLRNETIKNAAVYALIYCLIKHSTMVFISSIYGTSGLMIPKKVNRYVTKTVGICHFTARFVFALYFLKQLQIYLNSIWIPYYCGILLAFRLPVYLIYTSCMFDSKLSKVGASRTINIIMPILV